MNTTRRWIVLGAAWFAVSCASALPSHLHQPEDGALAAQAVERLEALSKAQAAVFERMLANLETTSGYETGAYEDLAERLAAIESRKLAHMPWGDLRAAIDTRLTDLRSTVGGMENRFAAELKLAEAEAGEAATAMDKVKLELAQARDALTGWNRRVAVLEKLIELTPDALAEVRNADDVVKELRDDDGKIKAVFAEATVSFVNGKGEVDEVPLKDSLGGIFDVMASEGSPEAKIAHGIRGFFDSEAPGLMLTIASLAMDIAELEQRRARAYLDALEERRTILQQAQDDLKLAISFASNKAFIADVGVFRDEDEVFATLAALAGKPKPDSPEDPLTSGYSATQAYLVIASTLTSQIKESEREDFSLKHRWSIERSQLNANMHEALVSRGLQGLAQYHAGGVKPEELAELAYQATQLVLLYSISRRADS